MKKLIIALLAIVMIVGVSSFTSESSTDNAQAEASVSEVVVNNIMARRSIRKYKDQAVPRDILDKIIECGINAPNGMNAQS